MARRTPRTWRVVETALAVLGAGCLAWAAAATVRAHVYQRTATAFLRQQVTAHSSAAVASVATRLADRPQRGDLLGLLEVPRLGLSTPVVEGDDDRALGVAAGHLPDTPLPWEGGNTALAGHRDTVFRSLRHVRPGDRIQLTTSHGVFVYEVASRSVVAPGDLSVLGFDRAALTLITCHPFDVVGPAPRRFVVHAVKVPAAGM